MEWLWLAFGLFAGFAMLSVLGGERQRRIDELAKEEAIEPTDDAAQLPVDPDAPALPSHPN